MWVRLKEDVLDANGNWLDIDITVQSSPLRLHPRDRLPCLGRSQAGELLSFPSRAAVVLITPLMWGAVVLRSMFPKSETGCCETTSLSSNIFAHLIRPLFIGSVQSSRSVMSDSLQPHGLQHTRPPCPSPAPRAYSDAIQPSHPLSSPSSPAFSLSQHQGIFQWVSSLHQVAKVLEFQLQHQSFQWTLRIDFL